jgi:gluconolactonase
MTIRWVAAGLALVAGVVQAQPPDPPTGKPDATIDLMTKSGCDLVQSQWRYSDVTLKEVDYRGKKTYDYEPHADQVAKPSFDDASWQLLDPTRLGQPRAAGKICFSWYRTTLTIPERVGEFSTAGATAVFETLVDDYGEIWVNGNLPHRPGQVGGSVAAGFNAPNRLVIGRDVQPGDKITLAVFGINAPISATPGNFIFLRYARLDLYRKP